jgi:AbrB family transcriptional regulator, stage V sporulation protein T
MKATGIVRRIDDLGRIVVPKEIRTTLRLRESDPMEIYTTRDGAVVLKKYSPLHDMSKLAQSYVKILYDLLQQPILLCDKDQILAVAGISKGIYEGAMVSSYLEEVMAKRQLVEQVEEMKLEVKLHDELDTKGYIIAPVNVNGDIIGAFVMLAQEVVALRPKTNIIQGFVELLTLQLE